MDAKLHRILIAKVIRWLLDKEGKYCGIKEALNLTDEFISSEERQMQNIMKEK